MGNYVITGGATGIGAAVNKQLSAAGHTVYVIDIQSGNFQADLTDMQQRKAAIKAIKTAFPDGIDGFVPCAGVGPSAKPLSLIIKLNYFAAIDMTTALMPLLEKKKGAVVMVSSNSASMGGFHAGLLDALRNEDETAACKLIDTLDGHNAYAGGKYALTKWMRSHNADWAGKGVRVNAIAPGVTQTPLTEHVLADDQWGAPMKSFSDTVPIGHIAQPDDIANVICFMLSNKAGFVSGSVFFVDGGHDAMLRPDQF